MTPSRRPAPFKPRRTRRRVGYTSSAASSTRCAAARRRSSPTPTLWLMTSRPLYMK